MRLKLAVLVFGASLAVAAQARLTVSQLVSFVRSSIELNHKDSQVADYLKKTRLTERLDERTIEELQGLGAGPKTLDALRQLAETSKGLSAPPAPKPRPQAAGLPDPRPSEQDEVLKNAREYALNYVKTLPDFICTQVTRRFVDPTGLEFWRQADIITARLSYFEQKENYKIILVNNRPTDLEGYDALGGATSTGEFGSMLRELFEPATRAEFQWQRWGKLRGRLAHVFAYRVAQPNSKWRVSYQRELETTPGYHGLVYVDKDTSTIVRVTLEANLPPSFPIQQASTVLDYDFIDISGVEHLLPLKAVVRMREGKILIKNEVEFRMYRKFAAEATITFETPEPLPEEKTQEQPPQP